MFDDVAAAVADHRGAAAAHRLAAEDCNYAEMDRMVERIRTVCDYLRAHHREELLFPLTMEWVSAGRDPAEYQRYRQLVDRLTRQ